MRRLAMPAAAVLCALPILRFLRGYTWPMALVTAFAIGALAYALRRTVFHVHMAQQAHLLPPAEEVDTDNGLTAPEDEGPLAPNREGDER